MGPKYIPKIKLKVSSSDVRTPKSFKWEPYHMHMARYVRDNYDSLKKTQETKRKIGFLRGMRNALGIKPADCTDMQLKNGYSTFYNKYAAVKQKLNSSGFGVDPERDATLNKGWIMKVCPYFDILDEVMGTRPNVTPPCIVTTAVVSPSNVVDTDAVTYTDAENLEDSGTKENEGHVLNEDHSIINEGRNAVYPEPSVASPEDDDADIVEASEPEDNTTDPRTQYFVKKALQGINLKSDSVSTKTPMGMFAKVMDDKNSRLMEVEKEKLKQQQFQFNEDQKLKRERNEIELLKVNSQLAIETRKATLEEEKLKDKKEERMHQIEILKLNQEFELKKLELQLKVPKI